MAYLVSEEDINAYKRDGVVCLRGVIDAEYCGRLLGGAIEFLDREPREGDFKRLDNRENGGRYRVGNMMWRSDPLFREFALDSNLPGVAAQLMGAHDVRLFYDQLFLTEPGTQQSTPWHNDLPFWPMRGPDIVSLWVALTPITEDSSPLQYLAGSHTGKPFRVAAPAGVGSHSSDASLEICPNYSDAANQEGKVILSWTMKPGDVLAHHPLTAHGSLPNTSKRRRCGLSVRYLGDDVQYQPSPYALLPLVLQVETGAYPSDDVLLPKIVPNN